MRAPVAAVGRTARDAGRRDVLARLLDPSPRLLARCRYVAVEYIPPGGFIRSRVARSCAVVSVGDAAREVLFEAAHVLAEELDVEPPGEDAPSLAGAAA